MKLKQHEILIMAGDSVTDVGRQQPQGEDISPNPGWGAGYVNLVGGWLGAEYPELQVRVINQGTSGNQARDLLARWDRDVLAKQPTWITVLIGINDVWRKFDAAHIAEMQVTLEAYERDLAAIVEKTLPVTRNLVLMTPYMIEPNRADAMRAEMDRFGAAAKRVAARYGLACLDLQARFDALLQTMHPMQFGWDRIHPNIVGHTLIANTFLRYIEAL